MSACTILSTKGKQSLLALWAAILLLLSGDALAQNANSDASKASPAGAPSSSAPAPAAQESEKSSGTADDDDEDEAKAAELPSKHLRIPVMFMTDRDFNEKDNSFGNRRNFESSSIYDVFCGTVNVSIENKKRKKINTLRGSLGWQAQDKPEDISIDFLDGKPEAQKKLDRFGEEVVRVSEKSGQKEICVFVHGFNNSFECAARRAARIAYVMERPVVVYSWPSRAKLFQYFVDSGNNEWSQEHFNRLEEKLLDLKQKHGIKPVMIAHSMGNRLVVRSAPILEGKQLFEKVFLVDPDFDSQTFLHYLGRYVHKKVLADNGKMRILYSQKDNALPVAQKLYGGYSRLGQGAGAIVESFLNPKNILPSTIIENGKNLLDKDNFNFRWLFGGDNKEGIAAKNFFLKELEWIDFTVLDYGLMGHSVPYQLIANLAKESLPGKGLELVDEKITAVSLKGKVLKSMLGRKTLQQRNPYNLGVCKRVIFTDESNKPSADIAVTDEKEDIR